MVYLDRVEWVIIPDATTKVAALETGLVDQVRDLPTTAYASLAKNPELSVWKVPGGSLYIWWFNHLYPPFNNVLARRAVQAAGNQKEFLAVAAPEPLVQTCYSFYGCGGPLETQAGSEGLRTPNLEKARQLVRDSGYNGEPVVVIAATDQTYAINGARVAKSVLESIGMKVDLVAGDFANIQARRTKKPPAEGGWNFLITAPPVKPVLQDLFQAWLNPANFGWYDNKEIQGLLDKLLLTRDPGEQKRLREEIQRLEFSDGAAVLLGQFSSTSGQRKDVKGFIVGPGSKHALWNLWLDR